MFEEDTKRSQIGCGTEERRVRPDEIGYRTGQKTSKIPVQVFGDSCRCGVVMGRYRRRATGPETTGWSPSSAVENTVNGTTVRERGDEYV